MNNLTLDVENEVAVLTINRPKALNALNSETLEELTEVLTEIEGRDDIKVVILTGAGEKSFVAGADISEMINFTAPEARAFGIRASVPFFKLQNMRQVTIAAVNGFALGGGCEISMACDIRIASDNAVFGQPECGLGIIPGFGGTQRLARIIAPGLAKEIIYSTKNIDAAKAKEVGLVNEVYTQDELLPAAEKLASKIAKNAPIAVRACKKAINEGLDLPMDEAIVLEEKLFGSCFKTHDQIEGMEAFLTKRKEKNFINA